MFTERANFDKLASPIEGQPAGKNVLSMGQFSADDIEMYIQEALTAQEIIKANGGMSLLPFRVLKAVMRQPSTRTGGSMTTAMAKLGGSSDLISGMEASAEAKGESLADSWVAFATQADIIGTRTREDFGPFDAAVAIDTAVKQGNLERPVPVINLGDGKNEHPTQALGDLFTIHRHFGKLDGLTLAVVGDQERYRAFHSLLIGAATVGMRVVAVQIPEAPVPESLQNLLGHSLFTTDNLGSAIREADVLYIGRKPDEYDKDEDQAELARSRALDTAYAAWTVDSTRLIQMTSDGLVLHPRPRRAELAVDADSDPRTKDVQQMENMIPMRMAIIANALGKSIQAAA